MSVFPFPPCHLQLYSPLGEGLQEISAWIRYATAQIVAERHYKNTYKFVNEGYLRGKVA